MKNNKLTRLLRQAVIIASLPSLSFADVTLLSDPSSSCDTFNQSKSVIVVHAKGCPWAKHYVENMSKVSEETKYQAWHYYELTFSHDEDGSKENEMICGKKIINCPVTFIKNEQGQDFAPLHGTFTKEEIEEALDKASSSTK